MADHWLVLLASTVLLAFACLSSKTACNALPFPSSSSSSDSSAASSASRSQAKDSCGYQSCNLGKPGLINVHLLAHTHDDVGWLKTVDQYYYGARNNIQQAGVQYILDSVVDELSLDPSRRFIYVETAFFRQWWLEQTEETQSLVKQLVNAGRLEFINGGWCMNDEAATHYIDIIDQMSLGLGVLNDVFGECGRPRVAWQIDPFGHSKEHASLIAQMGYDGLFFGRLDHQDKAKRLADKSMEMLWQASDSLDGNTASIFTGALFNTYFAPSGFCFDILCNDQPVIDDPESREYNVDERVNNFLAVVQEQADRYDNSDNVLVTMGSDFTYQDANLWFKNMDKLIKYANMRQVNGSRYNLFYSTPSCYLKSLNDAGKTWPVKTDDFFPYGSDEHSYWTGYFTSRPTSKYMLRESSNLLQTCKQAAAILTLNSGANSGDVFAMKEAVAIMQHHDAATGTEKQHVADDYARRMHIGIDECHKTIASHYQKSLPISAGTDLPPVTFCNLLNTSSCDTTETGSQFVVNVYNGMARIVDQFVRVPVTQGTYQVQDPQGNVVASQLVPLPIYVLIIAGRDSSATHELIFEASQLPSGGFKSYFVQQQAVSKKVSQKKSDKKANNEDINILADSIISNGQVTVTVDQTNRMIKSVTVGDKTYPIKQEFLWYEGMKGDNGDASRRASGAYIFRPNGDSPYPITSAPTISGIYSGELVHEIHQKFSSWIGQTIRIYKGQDHVELDWVVGPIPIIDNFGKEIISRFTTDIASKGIYYTDANGRQNVERKRDSRSTWTYSVTEPVSANYYPVNSHIFLNDLSDQMTIVNDRAQGGASLVDGQLEVMLHRRLLYDDAFGVDEALNEEQFATGLVARGTTYLILGPAAEAAKSYRHLAQQLYRKPQLSFIGTTSSFMQWSSEYRTQGQWIKTLPDNVNLLTLEPHSSGKYLLRLEHMFGVGEDAELSKPVTVSIADLITGYTITGADEMMLGANQYKADSDRLPWNVAASAQSTTGKVQLQPLAITDIELKPMEIRTFLVTISAN